MPRFGKIYALILVASIPLCAAATHLATMNEIIAASTTSDWRALDPQNTLYLDFATGRVVIELAPAFAPLHVANIKRLVEEHYYDGLSIVRVQDNYVVQWGDPDHRHPTPSSALSVVPEFDHPLEGEIPFTVLPDHDVYAAQVGFSNGFPAARDPSAKLTWLAHCYGMLGAGRDVDPMSGGGAELYVVIGQSPRHLDRNVALVGRVVKGIELLSSLPRGAAPMGFYEKPAQNVKIDQIRLAADLPPAERTPLQIMRTDTPTFKALIESRRNRSEDWYHFRANRIELCNVPLPVRAATR